MDKEVIASISIDYDCENIIIKDFINSFSFVFKLNLLFLIIFYKLILNFVEKKVIKY